MDGTDTFEACGGEALPPPLERTHPELAEHLRLIVAGQHTVRCVQATVGRRAYLLRSGQVVQGREAERNDPCPCGSGRKFKRCHG